MEDPNQPNFKQMAGYALAGIAFALLTGPMLYSRYIRKSDMDFWSMESISSFLPLWAISAVIIVLVLIGSHGDPDA